MKTINKRCTDVPLLYVRAEAQAIQDRAPLKGPPFSQLKNHFYSGPLYQTKLSPMRNENF